MNGKLGLGRGRGNGAHKTKPPARGGRLRYSGPIYSVRKLLALMRRVPGDALDIRTADADIGELTVAQVVELGEALVVALPRADHTDKAGKHCLLPLSPPPSEVPAHAGRLESLFAK